MSPTNPAPERGSFLSSEGLCLRPNLRSAQIANTTMWHNLVWIGGIWLVALVFAWLICHWRGYNAAAWAFTISAFCLGLLVGAENTTNGKFKVPFLSGQHHRHLIHHAASR